MSYTVNQLLELQELEHADVITLLHLLGWRYGLEDHEDFVKMTVIDDEAIFTLHILKENSDLPRWTRNMRYLFSSLEFIHQISIDKLLSMVYDSDSYKRRNRKVSNDKSNT